MSRWSLLWLWLVFVSAVVSAQESIVLLPPDSSTLPDPRRVCLRRIAAELSSAGFVVAALPDALVHSEADSLMRVVRDRNAVAVITLEPQRSCAPVLWMPDAARGIVQPRRTGGDSEESHAVLALRAVEMLRADLLEFASVATSPSDVTDESRSDAVSAGTPTYATGMRLSAAAGVGLTPGGFSPFGIALLECSWVPVRRIGIKGFVYFPVGTSEYSDVSGEVSLVTGSVGIGLMAQTPVLRRRFRADVSFGVSGQLTSASGTPSASYAGRREVARSVGPWARLGMSQRLGGRVSLRGDLHLSLILPSLEIRTATAVRSFGLPWFGGTLGLDFGRSAIP